jgi:hypothetical protein
VNGFIVGANPVDWDQAASGAVRLQLLPGVAARALQRRERGRHLAGRLARELGPGYQVTYQGDGSIPEQDVTGTEPAT